MLPFLALLLFFTEMRDVEFARTGGLSLKLDAWTPGTGVPEAAVVLVHGGGWEAGDKRTYIRPWFDTLTKAGVAWYSVDYRLGPTWKHPAAVEDVEAAVRWVQARGVRRVVLMGESAGGHIAALAALRGAVKVDALVSFYGIHDIPLWVQQRAELPKNIAGYLARSDAAGLREASPVTYVRPGGIPILLVHGTADKGVPYAQSEVLCKAVGPTCELLLIEGAPHGVENWEKDPRFQVWKPRVVEWLGRVLTRSRGTVPLKAPR